jgi:hypothetical protein
LLADDLAGRIFGSQVGQIVSVDDPLNLGRVKVVIDSMSGEQAEFASNWCNVIGAFNGKQPASLIGQRVNINFTDGDPKRPVIQDVIYDTKSTAPAQASTMVRLPIYAVGELPPATEENRGCLALVINDTYGDYLVCCLNRNGTFLWERMSALTHTHKGQLPGTQANDSRGDTEQPVIQDTSTIFDEVTPTTDSPQFGGLSGAT